jgi:hypothetical protein
MNLSVLSWKLADYQDNNEEAPDRILENPEMCEGDLMNDDELEEYLKDSLATIKILTDKGSKAAERLQNIYLADLEFLVKLGRLEVEDYNELSKLDNFKF